MDQDFTDFAPPGAPDTLSTNRLHGVYATATIGGITTMHLFDWEIRIGQTLLDASGHGDEWDQMVPLRQRWSGRAKGYMTRAAAASATYVAGLSKISASPGEVTFTAYSDMGNTVIFQGGIFAEDIVISSPQAMVTQEVSFKGSMAPSAGPTA